MLWWLLIGFGVLCICATVVVYCAMVVGSRYEDDPPQPPVDRLYTSAPNGKVERADVAQRRL